MTQQETDEGSPLTPEDRKNLERHCKFIVHLGCYSENFPPGYSEPEPNIDLAQILRPQPSILSMGRDAN